MRVTEDTKKIDDFFQAMLGTMRHCRTETRKYLRLKIVVIGEIRTRVSSEMERTHMTHE